jgi:prepilin-type N-terminal cleavage/methylation domain-containing protein
MYKKGFTLIELLVVISIISLLSSVVLASLNTARAKGRDAKRALTVRQLKLALEYYYDANGAYPSLGSDGNGYDILGLQTPLAPYIAAVTGDPQGQYWQYVRGPSNAYGLYIYRESAGTFCGTGVNFNPGWWSVGSNLCPF